MEGGGGGEVLIGVGLVFYLRGSSFDFFECRIVSY